MKETIIAIINKQPIVVADGEEPMVAIRPICDALGIDRKTQQDKIKEDPKYAGAWKVIPFTSNSDGKTYDQFCLNRRRIHVWILGIHSSKVNEGAREELVKYQIECSDAIYDYFENKHSYQLKLVERRAELQKKRADLAEQKKEIKSAMDDVDDELKKIDEELVNPQLPIPGLV